jgi:hypothetical protein
MIFPYASRSFIPSLACVSCQARRAVQPHRHGRALTRPSTSLIWLAFEGVDARDKPGHDEL